MQYSQKFYFSIIFIYSFCLSANAQFVDNFSDGDLSKNPTWQGDVNNFVINSAKELQLQAPDAGTSTILTPFTMPDSTVWEIYTRLEFAASTSNQLRIYLMWDGNDFSKGKGYYLELGESGNNDAIRLIRADNTNTTLATGTLAGVANEPTAVRIRVTRDAAGLWSLFADYKGGFAYQKEFSVSDTKVNFKNAWFGLKCIYSATRKDKFFFDDIKIATITLDKEAPKLVAAQVSNDNQLLVDFDEAIDSISAVSVNNYDISPIGKPITAALSASKSGVLLTYKNPFSAGTYTLLANNIKDKKGNASASQSIAFTYQPAKFAAPFDVIITEVMADPSPVVTLPNTEFIELYNRTDAAINLQDFSVSNSSNTVLTLPNITIDAKGYFILSYKEDFSKYGKSQTFSKFIGLGNDGDVLTLYDNKGNLIDRMEYKLSTYKNSKKKDGGWSLERIDVNYPCLGEENWIASEDNSGGTPGRKNSIAKNTNTQKGAVPLQVFAASANQLVFTFDRYLQKVSTLDIKGIVVKSFSLKKDDPRVVIVSLDTPLQSGKEYDIVLKINAFNDCNGQANASEYQLKVALAEKPKPNDLVINEVLIDGVKFVELYNRSKKALNMSDIQIASLSNGADIKEIKKSFLLLPDQYVVLTENALLLKETFTIQRPEAILETDLPSLTIDSCNITILSKDSIKNVVIDAFDYKSSFHNPLLKDSKGISLERIFPDDKTQSKSNWQSAATALRATPTYRNSQYHQPNTNTTADPFFVETARISPDNDGYEDYLTIQYKLDNSGYKANARIYDSEGRLVKNWINGELLGAEGTLVWAGDREDGQASRTGIYIAWIQYFHPDGTSKVQKIAFAVIRT